MPCCKKPVNDWNYAAPHNSSTPVMHRKKQLPPMKPGPFFHSRPAPSRADGLLWRDILRHVPFFSMRVAASSMTNHTLRLRNRDGRAPFFHGVNTPRAKNKRLPWKCYAEA
jgi:hypothetical protein